MECGNIGEEVGGVRGCHRKIANRLHGARGVAKHPDVDERGGDRKSDADERGRSLENMISERTQPTSEEGTDKTARREGRKGCRSC